MSMEEGGFGCQWRGRVWVSMEEGGCGCQGNRSQQTSDIPITLMGAELTNVEIEEVIKLVLLHVTVLPFIAAVMFTVKMEDRQYVGSEDCMLEAL